jgi:tRNA (uracil-5-)-methyltransferase TRM9
MEQENQEKVWDKIAQEWHEFKKSPSESATEFLNNSRGKVLDFGSGSGRNLLNLKSSKERELYLLDFSKEMLDKAEQRAKSLGLEIKTIKSPLEKTPFENNSFDSVVCVAALHCVETSEAREAAVEEIFRILKPRGEAEIEVWNKDSGRFKNAPKEKFISWRDKGKRFYYLYTKNEVFELFKSKGFEIKQELEHKVNIVFIVKKPKD